MTDLMRFGNMVSAENALLNSSIQQRIRHRFPPGYDYTADFDKTEPQGVSGMTISVANQILTITTGTTANKELCLTSKKFFTVPVRILVGLQISQKIANQEFYVELVSCDENGVVDANPDVIAWLFDNVPSSASYARYQTAQAGQARVVSSNVSTPSWTTARTCIAELELFPDEAWFHTRTMNSTAARAGTNVAHDQIPDPSKFYKLRIRALNLTSAPGSSTTFNLYFMQILDYNELCVEVVAGRGASAAGQSLPVYGVGGSMSMSLTNAGSTYTAETTTNLGAGATYTGSQRDQASSTTMYYNRFRVMVAHQAGLIPGHLVFEQSTDATTWRETHRVPIPSDGQHRTFEFPWQIRYGRIKFVNGATAQTSMYISGTWIRIDGPFDTDKTLTFIHSTTPLGGSASFTGVTLNLGPNHSFNRHRAMVYADQAGTLYLAESRDGTTFRRIANIAVAVGETKVLDNLITCQYVRVEYANGATAQGAFELVSALVRQ